MNNTSETTSKPSRAEFVPFSPHAEVRVYRRNLPHWRQDGCTYFCTFRQADSIPKRIIEKWEYERQTWLTANGVFGPLSDPQWLAKYETIPFRRRILFERRQERQVLIELDKCHGSCLLRTEFALTLIPGAMTFFHGERLWTGDFVIMPNHVHTLLQPFPGWELEHILQSIKSYTSTRMTKQGLKAGRLWQKENYDRIVRDRKELARIRRYVASNPEKAKLADGGFRHHSAEWLDVAT